VTSHPHDPLAGSASSPLEPPAASPVTPQANILLSPPMDDLAAALAAPGVAGGGKGPGWAEIRVAGHPIRLGVETLRQAATVAEPDQSPSVSNEDDWRSWLLSAATARDRLPAARRAIEEVAVAATVAALPRPVPDVLVGPPRIVLRIGAQWFDQLVQAAPDDVTIITTARDELARSLGIPMPAVDIQAEELPPHVFGFCLGNLVLPLRAAWPYDSPMTAFNQIAQGLVTDVRRWAEALVDPDTVQQTMKVIGEVLPNTVRAVRELVEPQWLLDVIRTLLSQRIPVATMEPLLERLLSAAVTPVMRDELVGYVRAGLARQLAAAAGNGSRDIHAYVLARAPEPNEPLNDVSILPPSTDPWRDIVLVTPPGSAVRVRETTRTQLPDLLVIDRDELPTACRVSALAVLGRSADE
jgi:FHIPEP family